MNLSAHLIPIEAVIAPGHLFTYYSRQSLFVMWPPLPATIGEERRGERRRDRGRNMKWMWQIRKYGYVIRHGDLVIGLILDLEIRV